MNKKKILFFDDEKIAKTLQKDLELFDLDVTLVSNVTDFFKQIVSNNVYDVLLMDVMAPVSEEEQNEYFSPEGVKDLERYIGTGEVLMNIVRGELGIGEVLTKIVKCPVIEEKVNVKNETIRRILEEKKYADTPVLFYSNRTYVDAETFGKNAKFLKKPQFTETIVETINEISNIK